MLPWSQWFCCVHIAQCNFLLVCIAECTCHIHNQQSWVSLLWPGAPSCRELCKREHATSPVRVTYPEYVRIYFLVASGCLLLYKASGFAQKGWGWDSDSTHTSCKCPSPSACRLRCVDMSGIGAIWLCPEVCACLLQWAVFGEVTQSSQTMVPKGSESGSESAVQPYPWKCSGSQYRRPHCSSH